MEKELLEEKPVRINERGQEVLDPTPLEIPLGFRVPESLSEQVKRLVRRQLSEAADGRGYETFDEANDFDIPDDQVEPDTPFEMVFDPSIGRDVSPDMIRRDDEHYRKLYVEAGKAEAEERLGAAAEAQERRSRWPWRRQQADLEDRRRGDPPADGEN